MNRKRILVSSIFALAFLGMVGILHPFFESLGLSKKADNDSLISIEVKPLTLGELQIVDVKGKKLFLLKPSNAQLQSIQALNGHVWDANSHAFNEELGAFVYWGHSTKWGCPLELVPSKESRLLAWEPAAQWLGGYWDQQCEVSYDFAGRAIKTYGFTRNGYKQKHPSLESPTIFEHSNGKYIVSIYHR